jgi:hypothetical protein
MLRPRKIQQNQLRHANLVAAFAIASDLRDMPRSVQWISVTEERSTVGNSDLIDSCDCEKFGKDSKGV